MQEIWKDIPNFEGRYQISNYGRVKSLERTVSTGQGGKRKIKESILIPRIDKKRGYKTLSIRIYPKRYSLSIHRLVAAAFIPNPNNLPNVNHKDNNPTNNRVDNLEWCTQSYNVKYAYNCGRAKPVIPKYNEGEKACTPKKVKQYSLNNEFVKEYSSIKEASIATNTSAKGISLCCRKMQKTANNFHWKYANN